MANVKIICRKIGIQSLRVVEKANELYRISKIRPIEFTIYFAASLLLPLDRRTGNWKVHQEDFED